MPPRPSLPLLAFLALCASRLAAQTAPAPRELAPAAADQEAALKLAQFVVTGVFHATDAKKAPTAISAVEAALLA
ncbi:MAG: hypothetical protein ACO3JJ_08055, partial [Opitutaceae bacterium]